MNFKKILFTITAIGFWGCVPNELPTIPAQKNHFDHTVFEENKLPPRAHFFAFESQSVQKKEDSRRFLDLNGEWRFHFVKDPRKRPLTFHHNSFDEK